MITAEQLAVLPLGRSAEAIALLAPGVVANSGGYDNGPLGGLLASFGSENAYYLNGFNTTDPASSLGGLTLPYGAIDQQEIFTDGYGAQYGRSNGGVINQVGKRGSNEWHFGAAVIWQPDSLSARHSDLYFRKDSAADRDPAGYANPSVTGGTYHFCYNPATGTGEPSPPGSHGTLGWVVQLDLGVSYKPKFAEGKLALSLDVFNVTNRQAVTNVYPFSELNPGEVNPLWNQAVA